MIVLRRYRIRRRTKICLIFLLAIISNSYFLARYNSNVQGADNVNVACWNVNADISNNDNDSLSLVSGNGTAEYRIIITSESEVAANYSIVLSNVPNDLEVKLDNDEDFRVITNNTITIDNAGSFTANDSEIEHIHTLKFSYPINSNNIGSKSIKIDVIINQIN